MTSRSRKSPESKGAHVLVVEDDFEMARLMKDVLRREGYRVTIARRGDAALALVESEAFDAYVLDKEMPGADGLDVLSTIRRRFPRHPVIFITAFGGFLVAETALRRGANQYLEKPLKLADLLTALESSLVDASRSEAS